MMDSNWIEFWNSLPPGTHYAVGFLAALGMLGLYLSSPLMRAAIQWLLQAIASLICALLDGIFQILRNLWRMLFE